MPRDLSAEWGEEFSLLLSGEWKIAGSKQIDIRANMVFAISNHFFLSCILNKGKDLFVKDNLRKYFLRMGDNIKKNAEKI